MADEMPQKYALLENTFASVVKTDGILLAWLAINISCFLVILIYKSQDIFPSFLHDLFMWGKTDVVSKTREKSLVYRLTHVPKSCFTHFYVLGVLWCLVLSWETLCLCKGWRNKLDLWAISLLKSLHHQDSVILTNHASLILGLALMLFQVTRRLLECLFTSVMTGYIHIGHYVIGCVFYFMVGASMVTPFLDGITGGLACSFRQLTLHLRWHHAIAVLLFLWGSWHQNKCHMILYQLRHKPSRTRHVDNPRDTHLIPYGDWFNYVSSPHYFAEILIYVSFVVVMGGVNLYNWFMLLFVTMNLSLGASVTHNWYHTKFKSYPEDRQRIIPFVF